MDDLEILSGRGHRSLARSLRSGVALFGSGLVVGIVVALVFASLIRAAILVAAIVIVLVAAARIALGGRGRS